MCYVRIFETQGVNESVLQICKSVRFQWVDSKGLHLTFYEFSNFSHIFLSFYPHQQPPFLLIHSAVPQSRTLDIIILRFFYPFHFSKYGKQDRWACLWNWPRGSLLSFWSTRPTHSRAPIVIIIFILVIHPYVGLYVPTFRNLAKQIKFQVWTVDCGAGWVDHC